MITEAEFDTVVMGIAMMLAVVENAQDEEQKEKAAEMVMRGLALLKVGVFGGEL